MPLPLKAIFAGLMLLVSIAGFAQPKCSVIRYSTEDGLSDNRIRCILKDHEGFMWFGTWAGINRFDGHRFISYKSQPGDNSILSSNRIEAIAEDKSGYLWLKSYDAEVYRFDKKTERFLSLSDMVKDALPGKTVFNYIHPADNGDIWFITNDHGLFRVSYNASGTLAYQQFALLPSGQSLLPSNNIFFFHPDIQGQVWIGTSKGLVLLTKQGSGNYQPVALPALPIKGYVKHFAADGNDLWFAGEKGSLVHYSGNTRRFSAFTIAGEDLNGVYKPANENGIYCTTAGGSLKRFDITSRTVATYPAPNEETLLSVTGDRAGNIWIEPKHNGIIRFEPQSKTFTPFVLKTDADFFNTFKGFETFEDKTGRFWSIMKGSGLGYYDAEKKKIDYFYNNPENPLRLFSNSVNVVFYDPQGVMWFTTPEGGLLRVIFHENNFNQQLLSNEPGKSFNEVRGIYTDQRNRLWLATKAGNLYVLKGEQKINIQLENMPADGVGIVYCMLEDRHHNMWLGTRNNGLYKAVPLDVDGIHYRLQHFKAGQGDSAISSDKIFALQEDQQGNIWAGTLENGLNLVREKGGQTFFLHRNNGLLNYPARELGRIRHLALDAAGRLWIATTEGLLVMAHNDTNPEKNIFKRFSKIAGDKTSLGDNDIQFIYRDAANTMWLATAGGGLNKAIGNNPFTKLSFRNYSTKDGLLSDYIISCIADNQQHLWLATSVGLSRFDGTAFRNFDSYDGLNAGGFSEASCTRLANGNLVFGTFNGYLTFLPGQVRDHKTVARLALTHLLVNNTDIVTGDSTLILPVSINEIKKITLAYNQNIISFDYSILDFRFRDNGIYAYRLTGFDDTWRNNKNIRRASYTNLSPGNYVFEVKSLSNDRYSNVPLKQLEITILPPPWKTWWAYLIYTLLAAILLLVIYRIARTLLALRQRISVEQKLTALKLRFYTNISHELRTPLTLIQGPVDEIAKTEPLTATGREHILIVRKNAARMARFINQLLDLGKIQNGKTLLYISRIDLPLLARQVTEFFSDAAKDKQIQINIHTTTNDVYAWADAEKIETVLYNLLANAIKFSPTGSTISVYIQPGKTPDELMIEVSDEGPGVDAAELAAIFKLYYEGRHNQKNFLKGTGIGLSLSQELINLHHGELYAKNNPGKGLTVVIVLQKGKEHFANDEVMIAAEHQPEKVNILNPVEVNAAGEFANTNTELQVVLLVEDNAELSDFLARQLRTLYRVEVAADGKQGLDKALKLLPDLIVSDIMMPNMDGITMLDQLKNNSATSHIPVVLLSAKYDVQTQIEGLQYGADAYITKPFNTDFLKASIRNLLQQRKKLFYRLQEGKMPELKPADIVITSQDEQFLKAVISFVENGMQEPEFDIDSIAVSVNMSRSAFYKKFKSLTNMAPVEFVNEMRLKRAKQLFDAGEQNIAAVGLAVGFNSAKYFSTSFRKYYQCSPSEYLETKTTDVR